MRLLIVNPRLFFSKKITSPIEFKKPMIILTIMTLINIMPLIYIMFNIIRYFSEEAKIMSVFFIMSIVGTVFFNMITWFLISSALYGVSIKYKIAISYRKIFQLAAYGFIPIILGTLIQSSYSMVILSNMDFTNIPIETLPKLAASNFSKGSNLLFVGIKDIVFYLWSGFIWMSIPASSGKIKNKSFYIFILLMGIMSAIFTFII